MTLKTIREKIIMETRVRRQITVKTRASRLHDEKKQKQLFKHNVYFRLLFLQFCHFIHKK